MVTIGLPIATNGICPKCGAVLEHAFHGLAINLTGDEKQYGAWYIHCDQCQFKTEAILPIAGSIRPEYPDNG